MSTEDNEEAEDDDPLESLLANKDQINKERLADALEDYIRIDSENGDLIRLEKFHDLGTGRRLTALLLGRQAAANLNLIDQKEVGFQSSELGDLVEAADSTIRHHASDKPFIQQDQQNGGYCIPGAYLTQAINHLEEK